MFCQPAAACPTTISCWMQSTSIFKFQLMEILRRSTTSLQQKGLWFQDGNKYLWWKTQSQSSLHKAKFPDPLTSTPAPKMVPMQPQDSSLDFAARGMMQDSRIISALVQDRCWKELLAFS